MMRVRLFQIWSFAGLALAFMSGCGPSASDDDASASPTPAQSSPTPTPTAAAEDDDSASSYDPYLVLVPDNGSNRFKVIGPSSERIVYEVNLTSFRPDMCSSFPPCLIFGASHTLIDGHDFLDMSYGQSTNQGLGGFRGNIDRVAMTTPPTLRWRLRNLDFSGLPGGASSYCAADPSDPCKPRSDASTAEQGLCGVGDSHDFEVLSDDSSAQRVELLVADTDNYRMMKVTLDYGGGNTCGKVESYLDSVRNPDWAAYSQPNNIVHLERDGRDFYLVTQRALSMPTGMVSGLGVLQLWELEPDNSWAWQWTFPDQPDDGSLLSFQYPHGGEYLPGAHPEGDLFRFGDASSLATTTEEPTPLPGGPGSAPQPPLSSAGGSVGVLLFRDLLEPPDYLYDLYQPASSPTGAWGFPRFAERVDDDTVLITDSGCIAGANCPYVPKLIWVKSQDLGNSEKAGYWTPDQSQLELKDQTDSVTKMLACGLVSPFWSQVLRSTDIGLELSEAQGQAGTACP